MSRIIPADRPTGYSTTRADGKHVYGCAVQGCGFMIEHQVKAARDEEARWHREAHKRAAAEQ